MNNRRILIFSEAGPPIGETFAEGGSLRAWGIAKSLAENDFEVTFAYRKGYENRVDQEAIDNEDSVNIVVWDPTKIDTEIINGHKFVLIRHSHAEASIFVDVLKDDQILIVDCYIPIHVEVSARESLDQKQEFMNFLVDDARWGRILSRGDYFLYASDSQKLYLLGLMAGMLLLNPATYSEFEGRFIKLPYCFFARDAQVIPKGPKNPTMLWYGGLYSWFDIGMIVPGLKKIKKKYPEFKFVLAGAKNPYVGDVALKNSYNQSIKKLAPIEEFVEEIPHQKYAKRFETFSNSSAIVYVNKNGLENSLAWRTRLIDYILADRPIITNGGDPLGEDLIKEGIGFRFDPSDPNSLLNIFETAMKSNLSQVHDKLLKKYSWEENIKSLMPALRAPSRINPVGVGVEEVREIVLSGRHKNKISMMTKVKNYYRTHGATKTLKKILLGT